MSSRTTPNYRVPALERAFDIIEALAREPTPASQAEVARRVGRASSEIFRILDCLEKRGYIVRDPADNRYSLSLKLYELGHAVSPVEKLISASRSVMMDLANKAGASCHLSLLRGAHQLILAEQESPQFISIAVRIGAQFPAISTNTGRLLLAQMAADALEITLDHQEAYRSLSRKAQKEIRECIEALRGESSLVADSTIIRGVKDVISLIPGGGSPAVAALTVPIIALPRTGGSGSKSLLSVVRQHALEIARSMGIQP